MRRAARDKADMSESTRLLAADKTSSGEMVATKLTQQLGAAESDCPTWFCLICPCATEEQLHDMETTAFDFQAVDDDSNESEQSESSEELDVKETEENLEYTSKVTVGHLTRLGFRRSLWSTKFNSYFVTFSFLINYESLVVFPLLISKFGETFFVAYLICMALIGFPLIYMELALGQYNSINALTLFGRMAPVLSGVGFAMMAVDWLTFLNDQLLVIYISYLFVCSADLVAAQMPWHNCITSENTPDCHSYGHSCGEHDQMQWTKLKMKSEERTFDLSPQYSSVGDTCVYSGISVLQTRYTVTDFKSWFNSASFAQQLYTQLDIDSLTSVGWPMSLTITILILVWVMVARFSQMKRDVIVLISSLAVTFLLSFIFLCTLLIFLSPPKFAFLASMGGEIRLDDYMLWLHAILAVVRGLKLGQGRLIFIGAQNSFRNNIMIDTVVIFLFMSMAPFFYAIFFNTSLDSELLNRMQGDLGIWGEFVNEATSSGIMKYFLSHINISLFLHSLQAYESHEPIIVCLFSLMIILMLLGGKIVHMEYYVTSLTEKFEMASVDEARKLIVYLLCCSGCMMMMLFFAETGLEILIGCQMVIFSVAAAGVLLVEIMAVCYFYGGRRLLANITAMTRTYTQEEDLMSISFNLFTAGLWSIFIPLLLATLVVVVVTTPAITWFTPWMITFCILGSIPAVMIHKVLNGWLRRENLANLFRPSAELWGPRSNADNQKATRAERQIRSIF